MLRRESPNYWCYRSFTNFVPELEVWETCVPSIKLMVRAVDREDCIVTAANTTYAMIHDEYLQHGRMPPLPDVYVWSAN